MISRLYGGNIISRLGEINQNRMGTEMKIIEYNNSSNIVVEFQDKHKAKVRTTYVNFQRRQVRNPYDKTVYGVGYLGEGVHRSGAFGTCI